MSVEAGDFDARRIGWWQRRQAVRALRRASGLMPADRDLRVQQTRAAQTRGELNALTRGLSAPPRLSPSQPPPPQPSPQFPLQRAAPMAQPAVRKKSIRSRVIIGLVVFVLVSGGAFVSCVSALVGSVSELSSGTSLSSSPDLGTEKGWGEMIEAFEAETDLGETIELVVRRKSATLSVADGDTSASWFSFDGDVTSASKVRRMPSEQLFDLTDIDVSVVIRAVAQARRASGAPDSAEFWVQVTATNKGPRIFVSFPGEESVSMYSLLVDATTGDVVYETRERSTGAA